MCSWKETPVFTFTVSNEIQVTCENNGESGEAEDNVDITVSY